MPESFEDRFLVWVGAALLVAILGVLIILNC